VRRTSTLALALVYAVAASLIALRMEAVSAFRFPLIAISSFPWRLLALVLLLVLTATIPMLRRAIRETLEGCVEGGEKRKRGWALSMLILVSYILSFYLLHLVVTNRRGLITSGGSANRSSSLPLSYSLEKTGSPPISNNSFIVSQPVAWIEVPYSILAIAGLAFLLTSVATLAYVVYGVVSGRSEEDVTTSSGLEEGVLRITSLAIGEIEEGDPRKAIVLYFLRLCTLLRAYGLDIRENFTAREVEFYVRRVISRVPAEPLHRLVELFEEARYSTHPLTSNLREEALSCLRRVESWLAELRGVQVA